MTLLDCIEVLLVAFMVVVVILVHNMRQDESKMIECENRTNKLLLPRDVTRMILLDDKLTPLNVKNNNPINIKRVKINKWLGSNYKRGVFESFSNPRLGLRAGIIVINSNILATDSVRAFVNRIVTNEGKNSVESYTWYLEHSLGYKGKIKKQDNIRVLEAMIFLEGGQEAVEYFNEYFECK